MILRRAGALAIVSAAAMLTVAGCGESENSAARRPTADAIVTYPVPSGVAHGSTFTVMVRSAGGRWLPVATYQAEVNYFHPAAASMAEFDAGGPVQVAVSSTSGIMQTARARPASLGINPVISADGKSATFTLPHPLDLSFEANGDTQHNLQLFVNSIARPKPRTRHVISFGPGVHVIPGNHTLSVPSNTTVEIAGGAVVRGTLLITGSHVVVEGHGVIDPSALFSPGSTPTVLMRGASNVGVRDITILGSEAEGLEVRNSKNVVISHVREINSVRYSDGIDVAASSHVLIQDSFLRTSDDSIAVYASTPWGARGNTGDVTVRDSTLFPDLAHPVLVGTHGLATGHNTIEHLLFQNLDILDHDEPDPTYQGALAVNAGDNNTVSDLQFENIRVEHITDGQLFNVRVFLNPDYNKAPGLAIRDIFFGNISFPGSNDLPSQIDGYDRTRTVSGVVFENVTRDGRLVLTPGLGNVQVGPDTSGISFLPAAHSSVVADSSRSLRSAARRPSASGARVASARSTARFTFTGTQARLLGDLAPNGGTAAVRVDGGPPVTIDTYAPVSASQQLWFDTGALAAGRHTIEIRALGSADQLSSGTKIRLEDITVVP